VSGGIATPVLTLALDGDEWSASRPGRFTPGGKGPRYLLNRRFRGGAQSQPGHCGEKFSVSGMELGPASP
jgi:hypothetical protein